LFGVRVDRRQWDARQLLAIGATTAFSGIVLYSLAHDAGHLFVGWLWRGTPVWHQGFMVDLFRRGAARAFRSLADAALTWMGAGGMLPRIWSVERSSPPASGGLACRAVGATGVGGGS
jgi:hypothetical protein